MKTRDFMQYLYTELRDPEFAMAYLRDALETNPDQFYDAVHDVEMACRPLRVSKLTPQRPIEEKVPVAR